MVEVMEKQLMEEQSLEIIHKMMGIPFPTDEWLEEMGLLEEEPEDEKEGNWSQGFPSKESRQEFRYRYRNLLSEDEGRMLAELENKNGLDTR